MDLPFWTLLRSFLNFLVRVLYTINLFILLILFIFLKDFKYFILEKFSSRSWKKFLVDNGKIFMSVVEKISSRSWKKFLVGEVIKKICQLRHSLSLHVFTISVIIPLNVSINKIVFPIFNFCFICEFIFFNRSHA